MTHFVTHITLSACCSRPRSILPLVVIFPSWSILKGLGSSTRSHLCGHGHLKVLPHHSDDIQDLGDFCLYWWGRRGGFGRRQRPRAFELVIEAWQNMLGRLPDLFYFESLAPLMQSLFIMQVKQDFVAQVGMNATLVDLVEAEIWYVLLFFQACCQPPKFLMEEGVVVKSEDLLL